MKNPKLEECLPVFPELPKLVQDFGSQPKFLQLWNWAENIEIGGEIVLKLKRGKIQRRRNNVATKVSHNELWILSIKTP